MTGIARKVELLHDALEVARIPHAFGGALALAYCVGEPRATADIDVNVFVAPTQARTVFAALPAAVLTTERQEADAAERGQVRIPWGDTPIDLFFAYHDFHQEVAIRARVVPFGSIEIPVLDCGDLVVFKALFNRPRDWVDIENVIESGGIDLEVPLERLDAIVGRDEPVFRRLATIRSTTQDEAEPYRRAFGSPQEDKDD
jgi:hypothetical protein